MADTIFTYENVKNNKEIRDQWRNYILQKFSNKPSWSLLTQILGDNNTLQIDKLTPESFNTINKVLGAPAIYDDRSIDTTPLRPPLMQKSAQQTPNNQKESVEPAIQNDKTGNAVAGGGVQGSNNGSGKKPRMSDAEINAFLNEELGGDTTGNGTYASAGVAKGGTKTIGYDPNPGNISLAYAMRNAPEQERRTALIDKWNLEHGRTGSTGYATGKGMLTSGSNGSYSSQEGMQSPMPVSDNWKFREAWKDPMAIIGHFGRGAFTDNEYNQLINHAVNDLGYNKDIFSGSRFV